MSNVVRLENVQQILKIVQPSFNELAKIHNAVDYRQEASFALEAIQSNDYLATVAMKNQDSFKRAIINVAAIGLSLNPVKKLAFLVPRKSRVCLDISYMGLIALAVEEGSIKWALAELVMEKDEFKISSIGEKPTHNFNPFGDRGKILGGYCVSKTNQDEYIVVWMTLKKVYENHRNRSEAWKAYEKKKTDQPSPWHTDEEEMIKKTLIRNASKFWPKTSTHDRLSKADEVLNDVDPLQAPLVEDTAKRSEQIAIIKNFLIQLNIDEDHYLRETLPKTTRRQINAFEELTDQEIDQILIQLGQLVEEKDLK